MSAPKLDHDRAPWLAWPGSLLLIERLQGAGGHCWFVGGAVRDALLGRPVSDVDLATTLEPTKVIDALASPPFTVVPTGLDHGTLTVIVASHQFEVTTLRRDVTTDGRRATVAFSTNWRDDAQRRDFTINALYAEADGTVLDSVGGLDDLAGGRVRFIGDPEARIREDALRILRFYRFTALFAPNGIDPAGHAACAALASALKSLSRERVRQEFAKLLAAPDPVGVLTAMEAHGIVQAILPELALIQRLPALIAREQAAGDVSADRRLAALLPPAAHVLESVAVRLRFSKADRKRLTAMVPDADATGLSLPARLYRQGLQGLIDQLLLHGAEANWQTMLDSARQIPVPAFPLRGQQLIERGLPAGPGISQAMKIIEQAWLEAGCPSGPAFETLVSQLVAT